MQVKHYINLTNGLEILEQENHDYRFIRIQSTACEQKRWDYILLDLDNDLLFNLAVGNRCIVYDYSNTSDVPRAIWQGLGFIQYCLTRAWFGRIFPVDSKMRGYFDTVYRGLPKTVMSKLNYYKKFIPDNQGKLNSVELLPRCSETNKDGKYDYYINLARRVWDKTENTFTNNKCF